MSRATSLLAVTALAAALGVAALVLALTGGSGGAASVPVVAPPDRRLDAGAVSLRGGLPDLARTAATDTETAAGPADTGAPVSAAEAPAPTERPASPTESGSGSDGSGSASTNDTPPSPDPGGGVVGVGGG
jgi:hypothetical protein